VQRLGVIDRFHLQLHREAEAANIGPSACTLVAVLDGRADADRLRRRARQVTNVLAPLSWQLTRDRWLQPAWRAEAGTPPLETIDATEPWIDVANARMGEAIGPDSPWRLEIWRGGERDALALRWFHPMIDARGAERLLTTLATLDGGEPVGTFAAPESRLRMPWRERFASMRAYGEHALAIAKAGPIVGAKRLGNAPGRATSLRLHFTPEESAAFVASLRRRARLADTSLLLHASGRLFRRLLARHGSSAPRQVVPVPLSLDPKRERRRMFGNHVTMMMLAMDDTSLDDESSCVASLAAQRRDIVRGKLDLGMLASLDVLRAAPDVATHWLAKSPFDGQRCSFIVSNPGTLDFQQLAGREVVDAFSTLSATPDPGLVVVGQRFADRMSVVFSWCDGYIPRDHLDAELPAFRADLLGE
jgi:hypothetical protein